ncbi:MAG: hypothetical protein EOP89_10375, partial [Lysobacteraceae bacterium]
MQRRQATGADCGRNVAASPQGERSWQWTPASSSTRTCVRDARRVRRDNEPAPPPSADALQLWR